VRHVTENRPLLVFLIGYFLVASGGVIYGNVLPLFASDEVGLTPEQWGYALSAFLLATLVSFWFWGVFLDRFGAPLTVLICWGAMGVAMGAVFFARSWPAFLVLVGVRGLFMSGNILAFFPIVMHFTESADTIRGMGLHFSLWGLRWVTMPLLVALVVDGGLFPMHYLFPVSLALVAIGVATMGRVWWRERATE
jgi:MFS family permease